MSAHSTSPAGHHELRYLISEETALRLRDFVREYLEMDEWCVGRPQYSLLIETLYLDSPGLKLFWDTVTRPEDHLQLRLRYHRESPGAPVTIEIKRCHLDGVTKEKANLSPASAEMLLGGELPERDPLLRQTSHGIFTAGHFWELMQSLQAGPSLRASYRRESYVSDDRRIEVNFDRALQARPCQFAEATPHLAGHWENPHGRVILELKFSDRFPLWFQDMAETFNLSQTDVCKYRTALSGLGVNPDAGPK